MSELGLDFALGEMADTIRETTRRFASRSPSPSRGGIERHISARAPSRKGLAWGGGRA